MQIPLKAGHSMASCQYNTYGQYEIYMLVTQPVTALESGENVNIVKIAH